MTTNANTHGALLRVVAALLNQHATRIDHALEQLHHATSPLRVSEGNRGSETALPLASREMNNATETRRRLRAQIEHIASIERWISSTLDEWAPRGAHTTDPETDRLWCVNHLPHGYCEPRHRGHYCRWCGDVSRNYGRLPTRKLIKLHAEGRRINDGDYRQALGVK